MTPRPGLIVLGLLVCAGCPRAQAPEPAREALPPPPPVSLAPRPSAAPNVEAPPAAPSMPLPVRDKVLLAAALDRRWSKVRRLIDQGADVNAHRTDGMSALHYAVGS